MCSFLKFSFDFLSNSAQLVLPQNSKLNKRTTV